LIINDKNDLGRAGTGLFHVACVAFNSCVFTMGDVD
jgi:hypothetical protein